MFNIGDLVKHKRKDIVELGLIINVYNCKYFVEWFDGETCWYTNKELATLVTVIS